MATKQLGSNSHYNLWLRPDQTSYVIGVLERPWLWMNINISLQDEHANQAKSECIFFLHNTLGLDVSPLPLPLAWCFSRWSRRLTLGCKPSKQMEWKAIVKALFYLRAICFAVFCRASLDLFILFRFYIRPTLNGSGDLSKVNEQADESNRTRMTLDSAHCADRALRFTQCSKCFTRGDRRTQAIWKPAKSLCVGEQTASNSWKPKSCSICWCQVDSEIVRS